MLLATSVISDDMTVANVGTFGMLHFGKEMFTVVYIVPNLLTTCSVLVMILGNHPDGSTGFF